MILSVPFRSPFEKSETNDYNALKEVLTNGDNTAVKIALPRSCMLNIFGKVVMIGAKPNETTVKAFPVPSLKTSGSVPVVKAFTVSDKMKFFGY